MRELSLNELKKELVQLAISLNAGQMSTSNMMVMSHQNQDQEFIVLLDDMLTNVRSIDDLFFFFGKTFPDLRESLIAQSTSSGGASPLQ